MAAKKVWPGTVPRPAKKIATAKQKAAAKKPETKMKTPQQAGKTTAVQKLAAKQGAQKITVRKTVKPKAVAHKAIAVQSSVAKPMTSSNRPGWVDELTQAPLIDDYAHQLESFISAMADGRVDEGEVKSQEQRVVALLKEIDPQLDDTLHARVTQLLCELTAYAIMQ